LDPIRLGIVGFGKVGKACAETLLHSKDLSLAGIVRRSESLTLPLAEAFRKVPVVTHMAALPRAEGALLCVPAAQVAGAARDCLQHGIPVIESSVLHGEAFCAYRETIHRLALHHEVPAIVGAGWDPGGLSILRSLFALLVPQGGIEETHRIADSLHHIAMVRQVVGVKAALCTEHRTSSGRRQRYVYVELEPGVDGDRVAAAIRADPLFLGDDTVVFPVESVAALEQGRGLVLERRSAPGSVAHQRLLFEARFDEVWTTAWMMLAAARALPGLRPGAYTLLDLPVRDLWGTQADQAVRAWL